VAGRVGLRRTATRAVGLAVEFIHGYVLSARHVRQRPACLTRGPQTHASATVRWLGLCRNGIYNGWLSGGSAAQVVSQVSLLLLLYGTIIGDFALLADVGARALGKLTPTPPAALVGHGGRGIMVLLALCPVLPLCLLRRWALRPPLGLLCARCGGGTRRCHAACGRSHGRPAVLVGTCYVLFGDRVLTGSHPLCPCCEPTEHGESPSRPASLCR